MKGERGKKQKNKAKAKQKSLNTTGTGHALYLIMKPTVPPQKFGFLKRCVRFRRFSLPKNENHHFISCLLFL
jgi:hypothetical protein